MAEIQLSLSTDVNCFQFPMILQGLSRAARCLSSFMTYCTSLSCQIYNVQLSRAQEMPSSLVRKKIKNL